MVAFSVQYEGPTEVYTMPLAGGLPVRRTFSAQTSTAVGWTPDGKIIYSTQEYSTLPDAQLEAAVKYLQEEIRKEPVEVPKHPPYPDKRK